MMWFYRPEFATGIVILEANGEKIALRPTDRGNNIASKVSPDSTAAFKAKYKKWMQDAQLPSPPRPGKPDDLPNGP